MNPPALYPLTNAIRSHALPVSGGHVLHVDEVGAAGGMPALVLHAALDRFASDASP